MDYMAILWVIILVVAFVCVLLVARFVWKPYAKARLLAWAQEYNYVITDCRYRLFARGPFAGRSRAHVWRVKLTHESDPSKEIAAWIADGRQAWSTILYGDMEIVFDEDEA
jgi:hypothetical protein